MDERSGECGGEGREASGWESSLEKGREGGRKEWGWGHGRSMEKEEFAPRNPKCKDC